MTKHRVRDLALVWSVVAAAACGGGSNDHGPPDAASGGSPDAGSDAGPPVDAHAGFDLTSVFPVAASRATATSLTIHGTDITGTPKIQLVNCDQPATTYDLTPTTTDATSIATTLGVDPNRVQGLYTVTVTNGDGAVASLSCALRVVAEPPPRVTLVVPSTAWQGSATDNINSDATVNLQGTGFSSTPSVRWVLRSNPTVAFDAVYVGFVSDTHLTAVVPSETDHMPAGVYDVFVTNPDQLTAQWTTGAMPGDFTITATPPPTVANASPARLTNSACTAPITITGTSFATGATAWYVAPAGTTCAGSTTDANGNLLCPITVDAVTSTAITSHFASCPALGPYPLVVRNPDGQASYWFSLEVTPSSDGHLNVGAFETAQNRLETARWKHAMDYGFDAFAESQMYVAGGQDAAGNVLGSVERSQLDVFGVPGPFHHLEQFGGAGAPRVANDLATPREGLTLVRAGATLFAIGGSAARSDTTTVVAASNVVERADILGPAQTPTMVAPVAMPQTAGLPTGAWYYRVSAIGPWGESLAAREVVAIGKAGQIQVCWQAPSSAGAVSYNIYRSLAADGRVGTEAAIAYAVAPANNCWTDTGVEASAPAPGNARATLATGGTLAAGSYAYRVSAVVPLTAGGTRETYASYAAAISIAAADVTAGNQTINLAWDALPITGVTYRVYRRDPATGTFKLLTGGDALPTTTFADTNVGFAGAGTAPIAEVAPLPPGSLSTWTTAAHLLTAREGLDGVVVRMDPTVAGGVTGRIIVAGGRDGATGSYVYQTSAESLAIHADGTTDATWTAEAPVFGHARGYYALLTTQDRNITPFPGPSQLPPCSTCGGGDGGVIFFASAPAPLVADATPVAVTGGEPVYLVAALGDDAFQVSNNGGRNDFESCPVDMTTGHLVANCGVAGSTTWTTQTNNDPQATFGHDAVLYFSFLYPFYGVKTETVGATSSALQLVGSAIARFPLLADFTSIVAGQLLQSFQSASTSFVVHRAYYQMARLLAYVYVVGGYAEAHTDNGVAVPAGPTDLVERHQQ